MVIFPESLTRQNISLKKGETLFNQGDSVERIYFIKKGKVKLIRSTIDGTAVVLHTGLASETIAEASLFSEHYHCSAQADVVTSLQSVGKQALLQHLQDNPQEMTQLLAIFSRQVRDLRAMNEIKNIRSAEERILAYLRCNINGDRIIKLEPSLKELAHHIGLAHETFYRALKKLEVNRSILRNKHEIKLL